MMQLTAEVLEGGENDGSTLPAASSFATPYFAEPFSVLNVPPIQSVPSASSASAWTVLLGPLPTVNAGSSWIGAPGAVENRPTKQSHAMTNRPTGFQKGVKCTDESCETGCLFQDFFRAKALVFSGIIAKAHVHEQPVAGFRCAV